MDRQTLKMHERDMQKISVKQKIGKVIVLVLIYAFLIFMPCCSHSIGCSTHRLKVLMNTE